MGPVQKSESQIMSRASSRDTEVTRRTLSLFYNSSRRRARRVCSVAVAARQRSAVDGAKNPQVCGACDECARSDVYLCYGRAANEGLACRPDEEHIVPTTQSGFLPIADISGYTIYLSQSELEHAQEVLQSLLELILDHMQPPLRVTEVELYDPNRVSARVDGSRALWRRRPYRRGKRISLLSR